MRRTAAIALFLVLALTGCTKSAGSIHVVTMHEPLPTISGPSVTDGAKLSSTHYLGKVLVLNVWAQWCTPCKLEQPDLVKVAHAYASKGVAFLGVDYADDTAAARTWIARYAVPYPSLSDPSGRTAAQLKFSGVPDTIIVDASGTQRYLFLGKTSAAEVRHYLDLVLASPNSASPSLSGSP
jgi:thiol-disulfide isomerase/thioredoxin